MTGLAIGLIKARDEISEVVVGGVGVGVLLSTKPLGRGSWTHLSLLYTNSPKRCQYAIIR